MEDKTFELLEKMYSEFTDFREEANSRFDNLEIGQKKIEITLEHDINNKLQALHEQGEANSDKLVVESFKQKKLHNK